MEPRATPVPPTPLIPAPPTPEPVQPMPIPEPPDDKMSQKLLIPSIILLIVAVILVTIKLILKNKTTTPPEPTPTALAQPTPSPTPDPTANWKTYSNSQYGFEIKYPDNFQALTDKNNLYGWPKAVVLFYKGGQSYDLPVEIWNNEAEYKQKYNSAFDITVFQKNGKFITLLNANKDPEVSQIIATFKFTEENQSKVDCKEPRPEVCTMECIQNPPYICGSDGNSYCSVCQACSNKDVAWYEMKDSPCEEQ